MTGAPSQRRFLVAAVATGAFALSLLAMQLGAPSSASAQSTGAVRKSIWLQNQTGSGAHMWLGHDSPESQKAWIIANNGALFYAEFKAGGKNANNTAYIDDKLLVNAMREDDTPPFRCLVTRTFVIRGFVSNTISVTYNGSDLRLNVQYEDDSGAKVAGGVGQASPSSAAPAAAPGTGAPAEGGGDDIAGMTPDQLTRAANAAIIAILAGLLAGGLGVAGAEAAAATASGGGAAPDGATAPSGPVDSGLRDPDTGEAIPAWEAKYEAPTGGGRQGQPGDVWYGGGWMPAAEAAAAIQATLDPRAEQAARDERYKTEGQDRNRQLDEAAHARQQEADANARAERDARDNAVGVAKEEATIELRKTIKAGMERNAQIAERQKANALTLQRLGAAAGAVETIADTGVDVISNYCGLPGQVGNAGYKGLKGFFGKVAEGQSFGDAAKHGVAEAAVEAIGGVVQRKLGAELKIPDLRNTAVNSRLYTRTVVTASGGVEKRLRSWTGRGIVTTVTGELFETPVDEAMKKMGWKQPND